MAEPVGQRVIPMVLMALVTLFLGLTLVWLNIERVDLAYGLKKLQVALDEKSAHADKLAIERNNLMSPFRLRKKAEIYGLAPAKAGQIRHLQQAAPAPEEELGPETEVGAMAPGVEDKG